jgi:glycosyltransferase involved in cell wall biosynthesis
LKTIYLIETRWSGHRPTYFKFFTKVLLELGHEVIALCPKPKELTEWIVYNCANFAEHLYTVEIQDLGSNQVSSPILKHTVLALRHWQHAATNIQTASSKLGRSPDLVFFAWLDSYLGTYLPHYLVDKVFPYRWSGLYFHPYHLREAKQKLLSLHYGPLDHHNILHSPHCPVVAVLDEGISEILLRKLGRKPVVVFPDFTDESLPDRNYILAKQIREKAGDRKVIGILGSLDKRKGLLTLLEVAQKSVENNWFFVVAGTLIEQSFSEQELVKIKNFVFQSPSNCLFHLERLPDESQFNAVVSSCDVLFAVYQKFPHSSNILTKAAIFKKPVLVSNAFCMGERVRKFKLGLTVDEGDVLECIEALRQLLCQTNLNTQEISCNFEEYKYLHSIDKLYDGLNTIIKTGAIKSGGSRQAITKS